LLALSLANAAVAADRFVNVNNPAPAPPYTTWATAAANIQDAIDAAQAGDHIVVTNGVYAAGGRVARGTLTNRVAITKRLTLRSVNGPAVTVIVGHQVPGGFLGTGDSAVRCVYLTNGAALFGFTLTNGATRRAAFVADPDGNGGAVWSESADTVVSNCILAGNSAEVGGGASASVLSQCMLVSNRAYFGGGAAFSQLSRCTLAGNSAESTGGGSFGGALNNCALTGNSALFRGGGTADGVLNNCTVASNSAGFGGGTSDTALNNSIAYYNSAASGGTNYFGGVLNHCCTTPLPAGGQGNITNQPLFVDLAGANLRLRPDSPCINAGRNAVSVGNTDLDGLLRIIGGTVDLGAYEFQSPTSALSYAWLLRYGLPLDGSADAADSDGDQFFNYHEWRAGTDPTNAASLLRLLAPSPHGPDLALTWLSVPGRRYTLEWSTDLGALPRFTVLATNLHAASGTNTTTFTHIDSFGAGPAFYRVAAEE
jgi:hypothetical protein